MSLNNQIDSGLVSQTSPDLHPHYSHPHLNPCGEQRRRKVKDRKLSCLVARGAEALITGLSQMRGLAQRVHICTSL